MPSEDFFFNLVLLHIDHPTHPHSFRPYWDSSLGLYSAASRFNSEIKLYQVHLDEFHSGRDENEPLV